jgi:DNA-binding MarR family transcriptional regulator
VAGSANASIGPWRALLQAHAAVIDVLSSEMQSKSGLPLDWYEVLLYLQESPGGRLRMHQLADSMLLSRSAITRFVDKMESAELVERVSCSEDRRGLYLVMTDEGRAVFRRARRVHLRGIKEHFAQHLTAEEATVVLRAMTKVHQAAKPACGGDQAA